MTATASQQDGGAGLRSRQHGRLTALAGKFLRVQNGKEKVNGWLPAETLAFGAFQGVRGCRSRHKSSIQRLTAFDQRRAKSRIEILEL